MDDDLTKIFIKQEKRDKKPLDWNRSPFSEEISDYIKKGGTVRKYPCLYPENNPLFYNRTDDFLLRVGRSAVRGELVAVDLTVFASFELPPFSYA